MNKTTMSDNKKNYNLSTHIKYLRLFMLRGAASVVQFEAALMCNLLEMFEADPQAKQTNLIRLLDQLKKATNQMSGVLNKIARDFRVSNKVKSKSN